MLEKVNEAVNDALKEVAHAKQLGLVGSAKASYNGLRAMFGFSPYIAVGIDALTIGLGLWLLLEKTGLLWWVGVMALLAGGFGITEKIGRTVTA